VTTAYSPDGEPVASTLVTRRSQALAWSSVAMSAALIAMSVVLVDAKQVLERLEATDPRWLVAFFALYLLQIVLLGLRWSAISRGVGVPLSWRRASAEYSLSILVNQLLPTGVAGDGWRAVRHARRAVGHPFMRILEALALDRVSGQLALILVAVSSAPFSIEHGLIRANTVWLGAAVSSAALAALVYTARRSPGPDGSGSRAAALLRRAATALVEPRRAAVHLSISLLLIATCLAQLGVAARAIGVVLDPQLLFWIGPLILLAASAWAAARASPCPWCSGRSLSSARFPASSCCFSRDSFRDGAADAQVPKCPGVTHTPWRCWAGPRWLSRCISRRW
jgi:hypothetical protein